jgi:hypothetical protein
MIKSNFMPNKLSCKTFRVLGHRPFSEKPFLQTNDCNNDLHFSPIRVHTINACPPSPAVSQYKISILPDLSCFPLLLSVCIFRNFVLSFFLQSIVQIKVYLEKQNSASHFTSGPLKVSIINSNDQSNPELLV